MEGYISPFAYRDKNGEIREGKYIKYYCANDYKNLRKLIDKILLKNFSYIPQMDYDDFYSIGGQVVLQCEINFDDSKGAQFETYLTNCLMNKIKERVTYSNRKKRQPRNNNGDPVVNVSIYAPLNDEGEKMIIDVLVADKTVEDEVFEKDEFNDNVKAFLDHLSKKQRQIIIMRDDGYEPDEIRQIMNLTEKRYNTLLDGVRTYKNISILCRD